MPRKLNGFTLIEIAVVLVIIGLMLSAVFGIGNAQIQSTRILSTKQKQEAIKLALLNFISRNNRLPCPSVASLSPGTAGYGAEAATPGTCTGTTINGTVATGIVPWRSLSLSDENALDGYYHRYTYQVTISATNTNSKTISGLKGAISIHSSTPVAMGAPATGNQTNDCTPTNGNYNPCSTVVVILSHGNNGLGAYNASGIQNATPTGDDELENANNDSKFVIKEFSDNSANPFDDIVVPLSAMDLLIPLTTHGVVKDYRTLMNEDVTDIRNVIIANAIANKIGSSSPYTFPLPAALPSIPASTLNDPWGNPYLYVQDTASISSSTTGSNSAFTLTSYGPDGISGGNDDLVTVITVNQLQDAFAKAGW